MPINNDKLVFDSLDEAKDYVNNEIMKKKILLTQQNIKKIFLPKENDELLPIEEVNPRDVILEFGHNIEYPYITITSTNTKEIFAVYDLGKRDNRTWYPDDYLSIR